MNDSLQLPADVEPEVAETAAAESLDFVWREGVRLIDQQLRQASDLDAKTGPLIAFSTALLALVLGQRAALGEAAPPLTIEALVVLTLLFLSFRLRRFATAPTLTDLVEWADSPQSAIQREFIGNLLEAYVANQHALAIKAFYLKAAVYAIMAFGLISPVVVALLATGGS